MHGNAAGGGSRPELRSGMGVLFMMPRWSSPSSPWLGRMMEEFGDDLVSVAAWDTEGHTTWEGRARAFSLVKPRSRLDRLRSRLGRPTHNTTRYMLLSELARPDITHVFCHFAEFALHFIDIWDVTTTPLFVHIHGYDATFDLRPDEQPGKRYFDAGYVQRVQRLAQRGILVSNSHFTKGLLMDAGIPAERIAVKHIGVPVPAAGRMHTDGEPVRIISVGRLVDFKSPDRTIRAFERACAQGMDGRLTVVGDGPMRVMCELMRMRSPCRERIEITGALPIARVLELVAESDIYTQHNIEGEISRQSECYGVAVLEAMAAGLPVVGTDHGGVRETVADGETGVLVPPGDEEAQAEALLRLARDAGLRQRMGEAGRARVMQHFTMEHERRRLRAIMGLA